MGKCIVDEREKLLNGDALERKGFEV
jgi:hypothetical protein